MIDDATIERTILALVDAREPGASICPSEAARALPGDWRELMAPVRRVAAELAARGLLVVTQRGAVVDPARARGPIRLRRP